MDEDRKQEQDSESEGCCGDKKHWHKRHHKHHRGYHAGSAFGGSLWFIGWLFTLGYLHMPFFWKGVLAIIIWPYYLGQALALAGKTPILWTGPFGRIRRTEQARACSVRYPRAASPTPCWR